MVQRYVANPYLVAGRKFDMRIYALVTSYSPLTVWLYRSGFCRFSSQRYSSAAADLENSFMHLTNVVRRRMHAGARLPAHVCSSLSPSPSPSPSPSSSPSPQAIQKKAADYDSENGGKWDCRHLKLHLMSRYGIAMVDRLFYEIQMIVLRSLFRYMRDHPPPRPPPPSAPSSSPPTTTTITTDSVARQPPFHHYHHRLLSVQQVMIQDKHCFELYGYDILFDDTFKPWLVEVNASPSLSANTPDDYAMKVAMLHSMLDISKDFISDKSIKT